MTRNFEEPFHETGLGPEYPYGDLIQLFLFILFFVVWIIDSLILELFSPSALVPISTRLVISVLSLVTGGYLALRSHFLVHGGRRRMIETGVYSFVRHPMYLGGLLFFLGFVILTLSALSFAVWLGMVVVYDRLASYEEKELVRIVGEEYEKYRENTSKWIPYLL